MKIKLSYAGIIFCLVIGILLILSAFNLITLILVQALILASLIAALNVLLFLISYRLGTGKTNKYFLTFILGGIGVRLLLTLMAVFLVLFYLNVDRYGFIFGLLFWYIFVLIIEIIVVKDNLLKR